jgi:hypothetical protein
MVLDAIAEPALLRALKTLRGHLTVIVVTSPPVTVGSSGIA